jgi:hypothetical protein
MLIYSNLLVGKYVEGSGRGLIWGPLSELACKDYEKTTKNFSQGSRCPSWDSSRAPPKYKSGHHRFSQLAMRISLLDYKCTLSKQDVNDTRHVGLEICNKKVNFVSSIRAPCWRFFESHKAFSGDARIKLLCLNNICTKRLMLWRNSIEELKLILKQWAYFFIHISKDRLPLYHIENFWGWGQHYYHWM